jgi:Tol biopolymer transport system component
VISVMFIGATKKGRIGMKQVKLVVFAFLAAAVAAMAATSAAAKPPGNNGLISFTRFDPALQQDVVYTVNPDGSHEQQLLVGAESGHWSPDGARLLVSPDCCAERILNPDTGSYGELPTFYPDLGLFLGCNLWSPDGARLACEGFGDDASADGVYTIRSSDGGDVRRVTSGADDDYPGDYSPNGKRIVFLRSSFDSGPIGLYTVKLDGADLLRLTPAGMNLDFTGGSWSPQGNEILFSAKAYDGQRSSIFVVHADGSGLHQVPIAGCGTTAGCREPVWSPDGKKIAFTMFVAQTGQSDLYTVNLDGSHPYQVTHAGLGAGLTDWGTHPLSH